MAKLKKKHLKAAKNRRFEQDESFFEGKTAEELIVLAWKEIERHDYRVVHRHRSKTSMTLAFTLYLGDGFEKKSPIDQAALLWHEIVHMKQWRRLKAAFAVGYISAKWRWVWETHGYRQQFRVYLSQGVSEKRIRRMISELPSRYRGKIYKMKRLNKKQLCRETTKVMTHGLGLK